MQYSQYLSYSHTFLETIPKRVNTSTVDLLLIESCLRCSPLNRELGLDISQVDILPTEPEISYLAEVVIPNQNVPGSKVSVDEVLKIIMIKI